MSRAPEFNIDLTDFWQDPYPTLARMRRDAPIAFVPQLNGIVLTRRDDIAICEKNTTVFSSHQPLGLMNQLMGHNMMRKDGTEHMTERKMVLPAMSIKTVQQEWRARFSSIIERQLDALILTDESDLFTDLALPYSAECLKVVTGLTRATVTEIDHWSQAMIDGISNYSGDAATQARCEAATAGIDTAIDAALDGVRHNPDSSLLSVMLEAGMRIETIRANIKLNISGGQNEPRDAIAGCVWALLTHPQQLALVHRGEVTWNVVLEEYLRWLSPIGMSPRRIDKSHHYNGIDFQPEDRVFFMFSSANRDEAFFDQADRFDVTRDNSKHLAFGAGPHFCAGAFVSRCMIADVALPAIFSTLKDLKLAPQPPVKLGGWAFRGVLNLPVKWNAG